jgi:hypothetical protein
MALERRTRGIIIVGVIVVIALGAGISAVIAVENAPPLPNPNATPTVSATP